jgi:hypothetical protein
MPNPGGLEQSPTALDIVYTPNPYFGVLFAERATAAYYGQIARAVRDSTTWGQFRSALPPRALDDILNSYGEDVHADDETFPGDRFAYGDDGWYLGGWPAEDELAWFPEDLIDKYGGSAEYSGPNYDHLFFPEGVDDQIAEELRARGHQVEKTLTGDLPDWLNVL